MYPKSMYERVDNIKMHPTILEEGVDNIQIHPKISLEGVVNIKMHSTVIQDGVDNIKMHPKILYQGVEEYDNCQYCELGGGILNGDFEMQVASVGACVTLLREVRFSLLQGSTTY